MSLWNLLRFTAVRRVVAYCLVPEAQPPEVVPVGTVPAPLPRDEDRLRNHARPHAGQLVKLSLSTVDLVTFWDHDRIEAICFRDRREATEYPGFAQLTRHELTGHFYHFAAEPTSPQSLVPSRTMRPSPEVAIAF